MQLEKDVVISNAFLNYKYLNDRAKNWNNDFHACFDTRVEQAVGFGKNIWRRATMQPGLSFSGYHAEKLPKEAVLYKNIKIHSPFNAAVIKLGRGQKINRLKDKNRETRLTVYENLIKIIEHFEEFFPFSQNRKENRPGNSDANHFTKILLTAARRAGYFIDILLNNCLDFLSGCNTLRGQLGHQLCTITGARISNSID